MLEGLKENLKKYFLSPLKSFFLRRQDNINSHKSYRLALAVVIVLTVCGLLVARLFLNLATVEPSADDRSLFGQLKMQAQKFINFAGNSFQGTDRQASERAAAIREKKNQELQRKLNSMEKFSRITFFYTAPYLGSVAIPESWEKKYRVAEKNNTIDFYYTPSAEDEYPLFQIGILSREEWEKKQMKPDRAEMLAMVSNFVFFNQIYSVKIENQVRQADYDGMQKQLKSIFNSFKSYKQE